jgi:hypothetical protein
MKISRCPYHVQKGAVNQDGALVLSDVCGLKSACLAECGFAPFDKTPFKTCSRFQDHQTGSERQVMIPKGDLEYLPQFGGVSGFSELDLM